MRRLSTKFRSIKIIRQTATAAIVNHGKDAPEQDSSPPPLPSSSSSSSSPQKHREEGQRKKASHWSVYLILSSRLPRTYVGVTTNFKRRLKQHNGVLKGGAKACSAGRPWTVACLIRGFNDQSEACEFESKWKTASRKMSRKKKEECILDPLLEHRRAALDIVRGLFDCSSLQIEWQPGSS